MEGVSINIPWKIFKGPGNTFDWNPKWSRTLPSLIYFLWNIYRDPSSIKKKSNIKVDIWHPTVDLRCRNPPRHLSLGIKSKVLPGPLADLSVWVGFCTSSPQLGVKYQHNIKVDIWHPTVGLRCRNPPRHLSQLKAQEIPLTEIPSGQELCRP
jgi:hypothetical protein